MNGAKKYANPQSLIAAAVVIIAAGVLVKLELLDSGVLNAVMLMLGLGGGVAIDRSIQ
jgi:hypothetical protein